MPSRRLRLALALLVLLLAPGCLGGDEAPRLAQPTDRPIVIPPGGRPSPTPVVADLNDPGYLVEGEWRVGDGWDYASNQSRSMRMRVVDARAQGGATFFLLETTRLDADGDVQGRSRTWVDARTWGRVNVTDEKGVQDRYFPAAPLRHFKNGSVTFQHTRVDAQGKLLANETMRLSGYLHPGHETIQARFGEYYEARKVDELMLGTSNDGSGARTRSFVTHWVHRSVLNDVAFQLESGERFTLTAFKTGDTRRGTLAT